MHSPSIESRSSWKRRADTNSGSDNGSTTGERNNVGKKGSSTRKGRPPVGSTPRDNSTIERRRAQVRNAQRNYRIRKDAAALSQNRRVEELEQGLIDAQNEVEELLRLAMARGIVQREQEFGSRLEQVASTYRDLVRSRAMGLRMTPLPATDSENVPPSITPAPSHDSSVNKSSQNRQHLPMQSNPEGAAWLMLPREDGIVNPLYEMPVIDTINFDEFKEYSVSQPHVQSHGPNKRSLPPINLASDEPSFAIQLHLRSLQRILSLLTSSFTPLSLLERTFPTCLPVSDKQSVIDGVQNLWNAFVETTFGAFNNVSWDAQNFLPFNTLDPNTRRTIFETSFLSKDAGPGKLGLPGHTYGEIIFPEEMEVYLMQHGVTIIPGSSFVLATRPAIQLQNHDYIRYRHNQPSSEFITLSKLYEDLMEVAVCLGPAGPAFRKAGVDRLIENFSNLD